MSTFYEEDFILPIGIIDYFIDTSYPIRGSGSHNGEHQVFNKITKEHFDSFLATRNNETTLAQLILLNEMYDFNLPIVFEETNSKIDTEFVKKHTKLKKT